MFRLIFLCLILALAVWIGINLHDTQGWIMIVVAGKSIKMNIWVGGFILIVGFFAIYYGVKLISGFFHIGDWFRDLGDKRRHIKAREKTNQGLIELTEGHWERAEKHLIQGAKYSEVPLLNYLSAAKAAQELGDESKRDTYLGLAHDSTKGTDIAVGLTQAQLLFNHGQYEQALATLHHLRDIAPHHSQILKLLKQLYVQLKDWTQLRDMLPMMKKYHVIDEEEKNQLEQRIYLELLIEASTHGSLHQLESVWQSLPKQLHHDSELVLIYATGLKDCNKSDEAEHILKQAIKRSWHDRLVHLYGCIEGPNALKQLATAEGWLKSHTDNAILYLTLGRLSLRNQLWGKAEKYFEQSLILENNPESYAELGILYAQLEKPKLSAECFKKGLMISSPVTNHSLLGNSQNPPVLTITKEQKLQDE